MPKLEGVLIGKGIFYKEYSDQYQSNKPFQHIYFDNLFDESFLNKVLDEFEKNDYFDDSFNDNNQRLKRTLSDYSRFEENSKKLINYLHSVEFLKFIQELTGIKEMLVPDPYLMGGGYHETKRNGFLKLHIDFSKHYKTNLDRRVNVILFLNKNWQPNYGGNLVLGSDERKVEIEPFFNRLAIFNTTPNSIHGQPDPVTCTEDMSRKSIALYYYSNGRPEIEKNRLILDHSTQFVGRNFKEKFYARLALMRYLVKYYLWSCVPPIIFILRRKLLGRLQ
jgi:Rps23 Pro-64 3,4-dihydroxylase Tpa1-like proline 4-hydroxylase